MAENSQQTRHDKIELIRDGLQAEEDASPENLIVESEEPKPKNPQREATCSSMVSDLSIASGQAGPSIEYLEGLEDQPTLRPKQ